MTSTLRFFAILLLLIPQLPSASLGTIYKTPLESFNAAVNFASVASADGITLISATATNTLNGANVTSSIIAASPAPAVATSITVNGASQSGQFVTVRLQGGSNNQRVLVDVLVADNVTGELFDGQFILLISSGTGH